MRVLRIFMCDDPIATIVRLKTAMRINWEEALSEDCAPQHVLPHRSTSFS
jgi:hypothetical protein